jgi:hypothetical protein
MVENIEQNAIEHSNSWFRAGQLPYEGSKNKTFPTTVKHQQHLETTVYYNATIKLIVYI